MDKENYEYLSNQIKYTGFGEGLAGALQEALTKQQPTFTLTHGPDFGQGDVKATLHFRRSEETGMVFFNRYDLEVKQAADTLKQTFYMGKENNFTLKEAYNLMNGRAVYKDLEKLQKVGEGEAVRYEGTGEKYKAWVQLDFKNSDQYGNFDMKYYHDNYGFNLTDALAKLPIKELDDTQEKAKLIRSVERGNLHTVSYVKDEQEHKGTIMAVPQFKTVKMFDSSGKEVRQNAVQKQDQQQSNKQSAKQENDDPSDVKSAKASEKKIEPAKVTKKKKGIKA